MTHKEFTEALYTFLLERGKEALLRKVFKYFPFLALPVLNPITQLLISKLISIILDAVDYEIYSRYVDFRADAQGKEFTEAITKWNHVKDSDDEVSKALAKERVKRAFDKIAVVQL